MHSDDWYHVLTHLNTQDLVNCEVVCRDWQEIVRSHLNQITTMGTRLDTIKSVQSTCFCEESSHIINADNLISPKVLVTGAHTQLQALLSKTSQLNCIRFQLQLNPSHYVVTQCSHIQQIFQAIAASVVRLECIEFQVRDSNNHFNLIFPPTLIVDQLTPAFESLLNSPYLRHLSLPFLTSKTLRKFLMRCPQLDTIDTRITDVPLGDDVLIHLSSQFKRITGEWLITEAGLGAMASKCSNSLICLRLGAISEQMFRIICTHFKNLQELAFSMRADFSINHNDFEKLANCNRLNNLSIKSFSFKHFDGALLVIMKNNGTRLHVLSLAGFLLTDLSLRFLPQLCPNISKLAIGSTLFEINHESPGITDETMRAVARLSKLEQLDIDTNNLITDQGVCSLFNSLTQLQELRIWYSKRPLVTQASFEHILAYAHRTLTNGTDEPVIVTLDNYDCLDAIGILNEYRSMKPSNLKLTVKIQSQCYTL